MILTDNSYGFNYVIDAITKIVNNKKSLNEFNQNLEELNIKIIPTPNVKTIELF